MATLTQSKEDEKYGDDNFENDDIEPVKSRAAPIISKVVDEEEVKTSHIK